MKERPRECGSAQSAPTHVAGLLVFLFCVRDLQSLFPQRIGVLVPTASFPSEGRATAEFMGLHEEQRRWGLGSAGCAWFLVADR